MKSYRFLFDPQTGLYQGIAREPFPDNCCETPPFFSYGFKTCWNFENSWHLVREEEFYKAVSVQDVLRDYDYASLERISHLSLRVISRIEMLQDSVGREIIHSRRRESDHTDWILKEIKRQNEDIVDIKKGLVVLASSLDKIDGHIDRLGDIKTASRLFWRSLIRFLTR